MAVSVTITKIDNKPNNYPTPIEVDGAGPWTVEGTLNSDNQVVYFAWNTGLIQPEVGITIAQAWTSSLPANRVPPLATVQFKVNAFDNGAPPLNGYATAFVKRALSTTPAPEPA